MMMANLLNTIIRKVWINTSIKNVDAEDYWRNSEAVRLKATVFKEYSVEG